MIDTPGVIVIHFSPIVWNPFAIVVILDGISIANNDNGEGRKGRQIDCFMRQHGVFDD